MSAAAVALVTLASTTCGHSATRDAGPVPTELRVGIGQVALTSPQNGMREIVQNLSIESLFNFAGEDGRPGPALAEGWTLDPDWHSVVIRLRRDVRFHDGTPLKAPTVAEILSRTLPATMGPARDDFLSVTPLSDAELEVRFRTGSPFVLEALEASIEKVNAPGVGTGPYHVTPGSPAVLLANRDYYLGTPRIDRLALTTYPSLRAAWAELLRGRIDMLYEVGNDALDSFTAASDVRVFTFTRRYQHVVLFNPQARSLARPAVRRALNLAIDRSALIDVALRNHGIPSSGPVWPRHWAFSRSSPQLASDPTLAVELLAGSRVQFKCLVPPGPPYERLALEVKRQLAAVGVEMQVDEEPLDRLLDAAQKQQFEAVLLDVIGGPTLFRPYLTWHSRAPRNLSGLATAARDAALDQIRHATSDASYRHAVAAFQQEILADPPALFLAWSQRARAVSKRFEVQVEPGRDVLAGLRMWKPIEFQQARHN
jgi:peptide/nickel transport system substrate-binding protein